jgi:hypothetical protein
MTTPTSVSQTAAGRPVTNDLELIIDVIRLALDPGYVLIGHTERVYRRDLDTHHHERVVRTAGFEADAVLQLLDQHHFRRGGQHPVTCDGYAGPATSVLVPKATRGMLARLETLAPRRSRR